MPDSQQLAPTWFLDFNHPDVQSFVQRHVEEGMSKLEQTVALYYAVRDGFRYDPYRLDFSKEALKSSHLCLRDYGYCVEKAALYTSTLRAIGVPARLFFGDVRNHLGTARLEAFLKTDRLIFHGCTEVWNGQHWVKATPVFNRELCERLGVEALDFDGEHDAVFQAYDTSGGRFMEYLHEHGSFDDVPYDLFLDSIETGYQIGQLKGKKIDLKALIHEASQG